MTITNETILAHEWIGLQVTIVESSDPCHRGLEGIVRDETKNTIRIETRGRFLTIPKNSTTFLTTLPNGEKFAIKGSTVRFRPEDRVKKGLAKW
jgi:ribonuclease P protein subunit POP4